VSSIVGMNVRHPMDFLDAVSTTGYSTQAASDAGMFHITDPEFAETIRQGTHLPWPPFVTECAVTRGIAGTPSVFVRGIPVAARPCPILAAVERVLT
jgi:hypothetical protein